MGGSDEGVAHRQRLDVRGQGLANWKRGDAETGG